MKKLISLLVVLVAAGCSPAKNTVSSNAYYKHADSLLEQKDFFSARDYIAANPNRFGKMHKALLDAKISHAFNKPQLSNENIDLLFTRYKAQLSDSVIVSLLEMKQANHGRLYQYTEAKEAVSDILEHYYSGLPQKDKDDYENMKAIWTALSGQPAQQVLHRGSLIIKMTRDKANLTNLPVRTRNGVIDFIFDTGANLSTVTQSTAQRMMMKTLGATIEVGSITGAKVMSDLAVCPEFSIGNITVKNAVFLVFPDAALAVPQIEYQINGIIGFPVIEALKEVQITQQDEFIVPDTPSVVHEQNMALDFLTPVIRIGDEYFTFDTGATGTSLYKKYFEKHRDKVVGKYELAGLVLGGAGGAATKKGYNFTYTPVVNGKQLTIDKVQLFIDDIEDDKSHYYGNIGQDLIKQFKKMTLNFDAMSIRFD